MKKLFEIIHTHTNKPYSHASYISCGKRIGLNSPSTGPYLKIEFPFTLVKTVLCPRTYEYITTECHYQMLFHYRTSYKKLFIVKQWVPTTIGQQA